MYIVITENDVVYSIIRSLPVQEVIKCMGDAVGGVAAVLQQGLFKSRAATVDVNDEPLDLL